MSVGACIGGSSFWRAVREKDFKMSIPRIDKWMKEQKLEPRCVSIDYHDSDGFDSYFEYVFERKDCVLKQYFGWTPHVTIEDHWNGDVLAETGNFSGNDPVQCAEKLLETARGTRYIKKKRVEEIIYKLMVGDLVLYEKG